jgi:hypothetical protein
MSNPQGLRGLPNELIACRLGKLLKSANRTRPNCLFDERADQQRSCVKKTAG